MKSSYTDSLAYTTVENQLKEDMISDQLTIK